ncbi:DUF2628 domain-containing protein [Speluncibacter jeojiensis]|uniref:DUF2628 domain-containing protein n=1 Tax=Speluncibacter jeojiensis TaxID=2710754 RepID=A0A9X4M4R7_9ACTN|nr:DUF2628 domain-containing protein [Corynebacteriales bacterium D3-21]
MNDMHGTAATPGDLQDLKPKWQNRFAFYAQHGTPQWWKNSPGYVAALKALPARTRRLVTMNWFACFFGVLYLLGLGLWKKAISWMVVGLVIGVVSFVLDFPSAIDSGVTIGFALAIAQRANVYHFDNRVRGLQGWAI